jgi:hypothetical protein
MRSQPTRILIGKLCTIVIAAAFLCASALPAIAQQGQQGGTQQSLTLKDPTPRPPDLQKIYETNPTDQAKQQEAAALKNAQIHQQVVDATNKLYTLAQQLHDDVSTTGKNPRTPTNAARVAQIEKLAKTVREKTRAQ